MRRSLRLCVTVLAVALAAGSVPMGAGAAQASDPMLGAPAVGQCFNYDYAAMMKKTAPSEGPVECSERHTAIAVAVVPLPDHLPVSGGTGKTFDYVLDACQPAFDAAYGVSHKLQHVAAFTRNVYFPPTNLAEQGAHWGRCDVVSIAGKTLFPIAASTPLVTSKPKGKTMKCLRNDYSLTNCSLPHAWAPNGVLTLKGSAFPSRSAQIRFAKRRCGSVTSPRHRWIFYPLTRSAWRQGERHFVCWESR